MPCMRAHSPPPAPTGTAEPSTVRPSVPPLAGMSPDYMVKQMAAFKNGSRPATVMHQLAKGYTDQQVALVAAYFANIKR